LVIPEIRMKHLIIQFSYARFLIFKVKETP
jgi:hypothetical protein